MEDPHEQQQNALLGRIVANTQVLNNSLVRLNHRLEEVNKDVNEVARLAKIWTSYRSSAQIFLETTKTFSDPK
ncbi:DASH complex subunit Dad4 [Dichotomocladium elegans]|nr:DASH complex subunit Dad4 [Dichotomocladium elegans]